MSDTASKFVPPASAYWYSQKPAWDTWIKTSKVRLWEAVLLACNISTRSEFEPSGPAIEASMDDINVAAPQGYKTLMQLALAAVGAGVLKPSPGVGKDITQKEVDMADFTSWLISIRHQLPDGYPWTPRALKPGQHQWPWGTYQTKSLEVLARAVDALWKNYRPDDPTSAPTNLQVKEWLVLNGVSGNQADTIATLIRADDLPTGRRPAK